MFVDELFECMTHCGFLNTLYVAEKDTANIYIFLDRHLLNVNKSQNNS